MRPPIGYEEAVKKVYDRIEDHRNANQGWLWGDATNDASILRRILRVEGRRYLERDRETLFERSLSDRNYYDMLRFAIAEKIYCSVELDAEEAAWTAKALAGEHDVPQYKSRAYTAHEDVRKLGLHRLVVGCVHVLRQRGLKHKLACEAVAEACSKHNLDIRSATTVSDIWKKNMPKFYRRRPKNKGS
ncbi:MAG: hypothetical protein ABJ081_05235 [Hyphomicrobiales bacterium]